MEKIVVGIGEALWDCLPEGRKFGGAPTNFAFHCGQFGLQSYAISALGNDELGDEIADICRQKGQQTIMPRVPYETGTVQVTLDRQGIPQYEIRQDVAWDHIPYTGEMETLAVQTNAVCWGSLAQRSPESRQTIQRFLQAMPPNALKVFDINLRQTFFTLEIIEDSLNVCNVLKINDEELIVLARLLGERDKAFCLPNSEVLTQLPPQLIKAYGLDLLILTCGAEGSYTFQQNGICSFLKTPHVEVADTVGAGDSFTAAIVSMLLSGASISEAHKRAVDVSAYVCTQHGAMPILPEELVRL